MRYVCFVYENAGEMSARTGTDEQAITQEHLDYDDRLRADGHFIDAAALQAPPASKVVRKRNGKIVVSDGPFVETKEMVGGYVLAAADNLAQAVEIARGCPGLDYDIAVEVRPVEQMPPI